MSQGIALFIFRRDFRTFDNTGLRQAMKDFKKVIAAFIFTPHQLDNNSFKSDRCLQFMIDGLLDLSSDISSNGGRLYLFFGNPDDIVSKIIDAIKVNAVYVNKDYTPYSLERDKKIEAVCLERLVDFKAFDDLLLNPPEKALKATKEPYTVFTPFYKNASVLKVAPPAETTTKNFYSGVIKFAIDDQDAFFAKILPKRFEQVKGGRQECLKILKSLSQFKKYTEDRDILEKKGTTRLSAHLKFTTCSVREVYHAAAKQLGSQAGPFIRQLYWRDFYTQIAYYFPKVFQENFREKYNKLVWDKDDQCFRAWCEGKTGFPVVDAGMRELNNTGYMHNRARMITACFLVKDLHLDWHLGEKYFATHLIDYDPCLNNGNWQWAASTGCDPQPYFRIFNPWLQSAKFDKECIYIKRWLPELAKVEPAKIHKWYLEEIRKGVRVDYPSPIVDHWKESKVAIERFKSCG